MTRHIVADTLGILLHASCSAKGRSTLRQESSVFSAGGCGTSSQLIPDSIEFGYALRGTDLVPIARAKVENGKGAYKMFEFIEVDLVG